MTQYGIALAKHTGLPSSVIAKAMELVSNAKEAQEQSALLALPEDHPQGHKDAEEVVYDLLETASYVDAQNTLSGNLADALSQLQQRARELSSYG